MQASPAQPVVLVIFHCQTGDTEALALRAAVGAVQSRALIRLRRVPDLGLVTDTEPLLRMRKEYVPPAEKDLLGADAIILVGAPVESADSSKSWNPYLELMRRLTLRGKAGACIDMDAQIFNDLGLHLVSHTSSDPLALGRAVGHAARSLKQQQEHS